jgi:hypothetical protein
MAATVASPNNPINVPAPPNDKYIDKFDNQKQTTTRTVKGADGKDITQVDNWNGGRTETLADGTVLGSTDANGKYTAGAGAPDTGGYGTPYDAPTAGAPAPAAGAPASSNGCGAPPAATTPPAAGAPATTAPAPNAAAAPAPDAAATPAPDAAAAPAPDAAAAPAPAPTTAGVREVDNRKVNSEYQVREARATSTRADKTLEQGRKGASPEWVKAATEHRDNSKKYLEAAIEYDKKLGDAQISGDETASDKYKKEVFNPALKTWVDGNKKLTDLDPKKVLPNDWTEKPPVNKDGVLIPDSTKTTDASAPKTDEADPTDPKPEDKEKPDLTKKLKDADNAVNTSDDRLKHHTKVIKDKKTDPANIPIETKRRDAADKYHDAAVEYKNKLTLADATGKKEDIDKAEKYKKDKFDPAKAEYKKITGLTKVDKEGDMPVKIGVRIFQKETRIEAYKAAINAKLADLEAGKAPAGVSKGGEVDDLKKRYKDALAALDAAKGKLKDAKEEYVGGDREAGKEKEHEADVRVWSDGDKNMWGALSHVGAITLGKDGTSASDFAEGKVIDDQSIIPGGKRPEGTGDALEDNSFKDNSDKVIPLYM